MKEEKKRIADYVWLSKTQRSWHIWAGNPFCIGLYKIPLKEKTEAEIIKLAKRENEKEKKRFTKMFPDVKWEVID
jgi:hypothetical protein